MSADQILFVRGGRIVERGTHAELVNKPCDYADLFKRQLMSFDPVQ